MSEEQNVFDENFVIYEGNEVVALFSPEPAVLGHTLVMPKKKFAIIEEVPDAIIGEMAIVANKMSGLLFDKLQVQGTNVLIQNGTPAGQTNSSFALHVLPRKEGDELDFSWENLSLDETQLRRISDQILAQGTNAKELPRPEQLEIKDAAIEEIDPDDLRAKQLDRTPGRWS